MMYAGPALAWFFTVGMKLKGLWLGMPYLWLASISVLVTAGLCFVRLPAGSVKIAEADFVEDVEEAVLINRDEN
jgi:PCFT/HCP family folate transporter-like MFS transporter 1/3